MSTGNSINITGSTVTGPITGGDSTTHTTPAPPGRATAATAPAHGSPQAASTQGADGPGSWNVRIGLMCDVVGYSTRTSTAQVSVLDTVAAIRAGIYAALGTSTHGRSDEGILDQSTGDGFALVLPPSRDIPTTLDHLVHGLTAGLHRANVAHPHDPTALRVAIATGMAGGTDHAITGPLIVHLRRVLDSPELRAAAAPRTGRATLALFDDTCTRLVADNALASIDLCHRTPSHLAGHNAWIVNL